MKRTAFVLVLVLSAIGLGTFVRAQRQARVTAVYTAPLYTTLGDQRWTMTGDQDTGQSTTAGPGQVIDLAWHDVVMWDSSRQIQIHADQVTRDKGEWVLRGNVRLSVAGNLRFSFAK
jgi:hypothetical protein